MRDRLRRKGEPTTPWCVGAARLGIQVRVRGSKLLVAAHCRFGQPGLATLALLDTGAEWSVLGGDLAEALEPEAEDEHLDVEISTRLGSVRGRLHRLAVTLVAEEGEDLCVSASVLLAPTWPGPPVLGYRGFLERIRLGLDPGDGPSDPWLFFGSEC
jgi:hypothetical protein